MIEITEPIKDRLSKDTIIVILHIEEYLADGDLKNL